MNPAPKVDLMPRFILMDRLNPHQLFAATMRRSRYSMQIAYGEAFRASNQCNALVKEALHAQLDPQDSFPFGSQPAVPESALPEAGYVDRLYSEAQAEDFQADQQSSLLILFADDALWRYARVLLGRPPSIDPADLREYGPEFGGVKLTSLLRAGTNAIRHVSEWDDRFKILPYPELSELSKKSTDYQSMQSIDILQRAFGIGRHELIRDVVSWRIVVAVDGLYGTASPDYNRFESAIVSAAREIAEAGPSNASALLESELLRV